MKKSIVTRYYAKKTTYNADSIQRFAGLQGIRKRFSVYGGPNDSSGLWVVVREAVDNPADLVTKGIVPKINVKILFDPEKTAFWVVDDGSGIPVGVKTFHNEKGDAEKLNTLYVVTGLTHGGSNFDTDTNSRGVNGIGSKLSNAMSSKYSVWTNWKNQWYSIHYKDAKLFKDVAKDRPPKLPHGIKTPKNGTIVYIEPDLSLFTKGSKVELSSVHEWCYLTSILVDNFSVEVITKQGKSKTFKSTGIEAYLDKRLADLNATSMGKPCIFNHANIQVALHFANAETASLLAYTNGLFNVDGGEHIKIVQNAIVKALKPYASKKDVYKPADLLDGIVGLVNAKMAAPKFNVQTKDKLVDERLVDAVGDEVFKSFEAFFAKNKTLAKDLIKRATSLRKLTDDFLKDKGLAKEVGEARKKLSSKLADVSGKVPFDQREIFLVEGDSAAGGSKRARNKATQAVLALRGKPLNVMEATKDKIQKNEEFTTLFAALGVDLKSERPFDKLRYGRIIFFADADDDGDHITTLLMAMLYRFARPLLNKGMVYKVNSPTYKARHKGKVYFGFTKEDLYKQIGATKIEISHLKGLGECNDSDLRFFGMDTKTRSLTRITLKEASKEFESLMGKDPSYRKKLLGVA